MFGAQMVYKHNLLGAQTVYRHNIRGEQTVYIKTNLYALYKLINLLKCLALPDHTFLNVCKFPLCSYKEFRANLKFGAFLKEIVLAGTKKVDNFLSYFMQNFSFHVDGQCLKISQLVLLKICDVKSKYIYLALICVLSAYIEFWI